MRTVALLARRTVTTSMPGIAGKVNESLNKTMSYKGPDGLTDEERQAYAVCRPLSCAHEACYKKFMYSPPEKQKAKCGALMQNWLECFEQELQKKAPLRPDSGQ